MFITYNNPYSSLYGCTLSILSIDPHDPELVLVGTYDASGIWNQWWATVDELDGDKDFINLIIKCYKETLATETSCER